MNLLGILTILLVLTQVNASSNKNYYEKKLYKEQLIISKSPDISTIQIYQCKCEIEQIIFHCSESGKQIERRDTYSTIKELSRDECLSIHSNQTLMTSIGLIDRIALNSTTIFKTFVAGNITRGCHGAMFHNGTDSWSDVAVKYIFIISIVDFSTIVANTKDIISISSIFYKYSPLQCKNSDNFQSFWLQNVYSFIESKVVPMDNPPHEFLIYLNKLVFSTLKYLAPFCLLLPAFIWLCTNGTILLVY